ncbi:hypothetical protein BHM03_00056302 [Ensete ventricosum]|nr:hypothetical protein BHM03_00056302 [Ensete ventricosum]
MPRAVPLILAVRAKRVLRVGPIASGLDRIRSSWVPLAPSVIGPSSGVHVRCCFLHPSFATSPPATMLSDSVYDSLQNSLGLSIGRLPYVFL